MRPFYLQISLHYTPTTDNQSGSFHPCRLVSMECWYVSRLETPVPMVHGGAAVLCGSGLWMHYWDAGRGGVSCFPHLSPCLMVHVLLWETLACPPVIGFLVGLVYIIRLVWSVGYQLYVRWEAQLTKALATQMEKKRHLIDKYSTMREECTGIKSSLDDAKSEKESFNVPGLSDTYRKGP